MDSETERTTDLEFGSQFNHTFVLPIEAALQYALDDFATYTNTISLQHELTLETIRNNNNTNHAINYDKYNDNSIDIDSQPNTTKLEQTYSRNNVIPHTSDPMHQPLLIELLLRYETPSHQQNTTHERCTPILPPWNSEEITLQHCTHQITMPILPPKLTIPPVPDVPQPTTWTILEHPNMTPPPITQTTSRPITALPTPWTHNITTPPHYHQSYQAKTDIEDEYIKYDSNNQYQQELHGNYDNNNTTTDKIGENTTILRINNNSTNYTSRASTRLKRNQHTSTTLDRTFTNKLTIITQNIRGLPIDDDTKLQSLIHQMKEHNWAAVCIQETWRLGADDYHKEFNGITQTLLNRLPNDTQMIFGQDINCDVGTTNDKNNPLRSTLGPHGINNRNIKGARFLQHLCLLDMKLANSFFIKPNYATWKNFRPSRGRVACMAIVQSDICSCPPGMVYKKARSH
jgi:hypothetical protein